MGSAVPGFFSRRTETPSATYRWCTSIFKEMVFGWSEIRFLKLLSNFNQIINILSTYLLNWCYWYLQVVGRNRYVTMTNRAELGLVESFLHELHRHTSITCISFPHTCTQENATFQGYDLPQDAVIYANFYAAHMDPGIIQRWWVGRREGGKERGADRERGRVYFSHHTIAHFALTVSAR